MTALTTHTFWVIKEKEKKQLKETSTSDRSQMKGKELDHLKKTSLRPKEQKPPSQSKGSTHPRQNHAQAKSKTHQIKAQKPQRAPPEPMQLPLDKCMQTTS
jgi:hypothetical protein